MKILVLRALAITDKKGYVSHLLVQTFFFPTMTFLDVKDSADIRSYFVAKEFIYLQVDMTNNAPVDVAYTEASMEQVSALVDMSTYCYQEITYDCQNAPLNGDNGKQMHIVMPIARLSSVHTSRNLSRF